MKPTMADTATDEEEAPRARDACADRLLGDVRGGVVAGVRPVRLEEREEEGQDQRVGDRRAVVERDRPDGVLPAPGDVLRLDREQRQAGHVRLARREDEDDDRGDDRDVPPDADLVEDRDEVDAGDVEDELDEHQDAHRDELAGEDGRVADGEQDRSCCRT